jgi:hypothetical protein
MKPLRLILAALALLTALPSCAGKKEKAAGLPPAPAQKASKPSLLELGLTKIANLIPKKKNPPAALVPQWTGVIRMVNAGEHFVLIEATSASSAVPGETYLSVTKGLETASLKMTSLKNPPFLIADIVSGTPSPGERIYRPKSQSDPAPSPTPKEETAKPEPTPPAKKKA